MNALKTYKKIKEAVYKKYFFAYRMVCRGYKKKLALGESRREYYRNPGWLQIDYECSDININFENYPYEHDVPEISMCYSSHVLEHISNEAADFLIRFIYKKMKSGAVIRIEVPDVNKIINDYRDGKERKIANYFTDSNRVDLVDCLNLGKEYGQEHIGTLGAISCYVKKINGSTVHIPALISKKTFEENLQNMDNESFARWCIDLQTEQQKQTHGHINYWTEGKLINLLKKYGFREVERMYVGKTNRNFDLSIERKHRGFYSVIVEAIK